VSKDLKGKEIGKAIQKKETEKYLNENKQQIGNIQRLLQMYGHSKNAATKMIKKNYKKVAKKFRGDSDRDLAMALIGYHTIGETNEIAARKKPKKFKDIYNSLPIDLKKRVYNLKNYQLP